MLYIWLKFLVFYKRFHDNNELWLKSLLFKKNFLKNTLIFLKILSLNDLCVGWKIKIYIKSIGRYIYLKSKDSLSKDSKGFSNCFKTVRRNALFSYKIILIATGQFICASGEVVM